MANRVPAVQEGLRACLLVAHLTQRTPGVHAAEGSQCAWPATRGTLAEGVLYMYGHPGYRQPKQACVVVHVEREIGRDGGRRRT